MKSLTDAQAVEFFHVAFLDALSKRLDPARYIVKGGANLRYFFGSLRYSQDIDLDMNGVEPWQLADKVDGVLASGALNALIRIGGLAVGEVTKPKQTDTTRRWKVVVKVAGRSDPVRTKIEFSNRNGEDRYRLEPVPRHIVEPYALRPPVVQHYTADAATEQKVLALADRKETQARDVFDLDLLLRARPLPSGALDPTTLGEAANLALELPFAAFRDQVLPFLEDEAAQLYDSKEAWGQMQAFVAEKLEQAR